MIAAAKEAHIRLVLVRDEFDPAEADWQTPFLVQISRLVRSSKAYRLEQAVS